MQTKSLERGFREGSKTFSLAARIFPRHTFQAACELYAWCRYCDDAVDSPANPAEVPEQVKLLRELTQKAYLGEPMEVPSFAAFQAVALRYKIPQVPALDLIEGMAMDARGERYETITDLNRYAYHVAGTVGLMMTHILGAKSPHAAAHAVSLGVAMQLTNISRDILEDARLGRLYLPLSWLRAEGLTEAEITHPESRPQLARLAHRLVQEAEPHYAHGMAGLKYLSFRQGLAIAAAAGIYRAIGWLVVRRGAAAWDRRAVVSRARKFWEICLAPARVWGIA